MCSLGQGALLCTQDACAHKQTCTRASSVNRESQPLLGSLLDWLELLTSGHPPLNEEQQSFWNKGASDGGWGDEILPPWSAFLTRFLICKRRYFVS